MAKEKRTAILPPALLHLDFFRFASKVSSVVPNRRAFPLLHDEVDQASFDDDAFFDRLACQSVL